MLTIHKASAGSGKTFSLTKQYIMLLLGDVVDGRWRLHPLLPLGKGKYHERILAVTFTNKATEEMTSRIIKELALLAKMDPDHPSSYLKGLLDDKDGFGCDISTIQKHASHALADLLLNFSWFNVSTIDSFFQRVLNTFARELEPPPMRSVEIDDSYPIAIAVGKMLQSVNKDDATLDIEGRKRRRHLENWLLAYMTSLAVGGSGFNVLSGSSSVNSALLSTISNLLDEKYKLNRYVIDEYLSDVTRLERFAAELSEKRVIETMGRGVEETCAEVMRMLGSRANAKSTSRLRKYAEGDFFSSLGTSIYNLAADGSQAFKVKGGIPSYDEIEAVERAAKLAIQFNGILELTKALRKSIFMLGIFSHVHLFLEQYRFENDAMLLSDTGELLQRIISENEAPFIYERLGTSIHHYLIDEFQDTSQLQWRNLQPLVMEALANGRRNLIIGDEKQCIYRFRNSDPQLLGHKVQEMVGRRFTSKGYQIMGADISENTNWRSSDTIVRFNNTIFRLMAREMDALAGSHDLQSTYSALVQQVAEKNREWKGYVRIDVLPREYPELTENNGEEKPASDLLEEKQLEMICRDIDRQLSAGYHPRDIAVLVRKRYMGEKVIRYLLDVMHDAPWWHHGMIPIVSAESMSLSMSPAVRMIVDILRLISEPIKVTSPKGEVGADGTPLSQYSAAFRRHRLLHRFELSCFDMTEETDEAGNIIVDEEGAPRMRRVTPSEALSRAILATSALETIDGRQMQIDAELLALAEMDSPTLLAITERIIQKFISPEVRRRENIFITAFQDLVMDFTDRGEPNVSRFLEWWDRTGYNTNVSAPEGMDAINVLTIHKAKGLEYECVHVPFFSASPVRYDSNKYMWFELPGDIFSWIDTPEIIPAFIPLPKEKNLMELPVIAEQGKRWKLEQMVDSLNVAYVAFTRAKSELHIYIDGVSKASKGSSVMSDFLLNAIREADDEYVMSADDNFSLPKGTARWMMPLASGLDDVGMPTVFEIGEPTAPRGENGKWSEAQAAQGAPGDDGDVAGSNSMSALRQYNVNEAQQMKVKVDFEDMLDFDFDNERHFGSLLHNILKNVISPADLTRAVAKTAYRYSLTDSQKQRCVEVLQRMMESNNAARWFEGYSRVVNERSIAADEHTYRPDRIVWMEDGSVEVVDYKFGEMHDGYYRQVRNYVARLKQSGYSEVRGYLWFPLTDKIIEV